MLQDSKQAEKTLRARLNNTLQSQETMHLELTDGLSKPLEVFPDIDLRMKIAVAERELPLTLTVVYAEAANKDVTLCYSTDLQIPTERLNHGIAINVSSLSHLMIVSLASKSGDSAEQNTLDKRVAVRGGHGSIHRLYVQNPGQFQE